MGVLKWLQSLKRFRLRRSGVNSHPQLLATWNTLNRRKSFRINYAQIGPVGGLPKAYFQGDELIVRNISIGGLLVFDDSGRLGSHVGKELRITLSWPDYTAEILSRVVGAHLERRHIQFVDFDALVFQKISSLIKPAFLGSQFRRVNAKVDKSPQELWVGTNGDSLVLAHSQLKEADTLRLDKQVFLLKDGQWQNGEGLPCNQSELNQILICLSNISSPSERLQKILVQSQALYLERGRYPATG